MKAPPLPELARTPPLLPIDCLVIGGGQSGLMCGYLLGLAGAKYRVVDASVRVGDAWRTRPRNLQLFTSRQFCKLADAPLAGDPNGYPTGREFADYLERFARDKVVEISLNARVTRLSRANGIFAAEMADGTTISSHTVIDATGPNQSPVVPAFAAQLDAGVRQLVAKDFRDADDFPPGSTIAVVGDGASGRQIARELASGRRVYVARGKVRNLVPNAILGRDLFWWLSNGIPTAGMPAFSRELSEEQRWDLVNFLRALSSGYAARAMPPTIALDRPWLVAPDFTFTVGPTSPRSLREYRGRRTVLLVFYDLARARPRLAEIAGRDGTLALLGVEVIAVPLHDARDAIRRIGREPRVLFSIVTEGAEPIVAAYRLFAAAPHVEFLIDRQGYIRAVTRGSGEAGDLEKTIAEVQRLNEEKALPVAPEEHVH